MGKENTTSTTTLPGSNSPPYLDARIPQDPLPSKLPTCSLRTVEEEGCWFLSSEQTCVTSTSAIANDVPEDTRGASPSDKTRLPAGIMGRNLYIWSGSHREVAYRETLAGERWRRPKLPLCAE